MSEKNKGGRPTSFKEEYVKLAYQFCLLGATDKDLASNFDVSESTINKWKLDYPQFSESLKKGKDIADARVADALFNRALGYSHPDVDIRVIDGQIVQTELIKYYPPDPTSGIFWLKNRQKDKWRDKQEIDHQSSDGSMSAPKTINLVAKE